jgi:plastocyanin
MKVARSLLSLILAAAACLLAPAVHAADVKGRVVTPAGEPVEQAIVFLKEGSLPPPEGDRPAAIMDQIDKEFVPHVLPIVVGTPVRFPNHDQIHHHVYSFSRLKSFDLPLYRDEEPPPVVFDRIGAIRIGCNIHDWMSGVILVLPTKYFATSDSTGAFVLRDLPPGSHTLLVWHERSGLKVEETAQLVEVGSTALPELRFTLPLQDVRERPRENGAREYR